MHPGGIFRMAIQMALRIRSNSILPISIKLLIQG